MEANTAKAEQNISPSVKRKTLDKIIRATSVITAIDFVITPVISQMTTGEPKTLHEYLGLAPDMNELGIRAGAAYWGLTMLYEIFLRNKFVGKSDYK